MIAFVGIAGSLLGARSWEREVDGNTRRELERTASDVSGRATDTIRRAMDLALSFRAVLATTTEMTDQELHRWIDIFDAYERHPGLIGFGFARDETAGGSRSMPDRCPLALVSTTGAIAVPLGVNLCHGELGLQAALGRATNGGDLIMGLVPPQGEVRQPLLIGAAVYDQASPTTVAGRREHLVGWAGVLFDGRALIEPAVADHPELWLEITHRAPQQRAQVIGRSGRLTKGYSAIRTVVIDADGRWTIRVAVPPARGLSAVAQGRAILVAGVALSLLLALLVHVLSRSRDRALRLVATKTDELLHQALHDPLTGLPNRTLIMEGLEHVRDGSKGACAVMFIDLDDFKDINDTLGHGVGDLLLQAVANRLRDALRPEDVVGRLGGDEFVVVLHGEGLVDGAEAVADRLLGSLSEPFVLEGVHPLHVRASIGIAAGTRETGIELIRDADVALYTAKAAGRSQVVVFEPAMQEQVQERLDLETALRAAQERDQFFLLYQPTFELEHMRVTGVEALIRWRHPERGVLGPDSFIPLAEQTGLILPMGRWVLDQACQQAAAWRAAGYPLGMAVNVSARQLDTDELVDDVRSALMAAQLPAEAITVEITETAVMANTSASIRRITALKEIGVRVAIDDFGTGYSSLAYLQQFPVDQLKIDRSFIAAMSTSPEAVMLVRTLVQLGRALGIETLAEGIEAIEQRDQLQAELCGFGQGYLFARPLVSDAIIPYVHRWTDERAQAAASGSV